MTGPSRWLPNEKVAAAVLVLFVPVYFLLRWAVDAHPLLWIVSWFVVGVVALVVAIFCAVGPPYPIEWNRRALVGRLLPMAALWGAWLVHNWTADHARLAFAEEHRAQLSGPAPQGVVYSTGIPDGGTVIVRSPGLNPRRLPASFGVRVTGERIHYCEPMDDELWFCGFD